MFSCSGDKKNLIEIYNEQFSVFINPALGGCIVAAYYEGTELLRSNLNTIEPRQGSCFPMAPFCGWFPDHSFVWGGNKFYLPPNLVACKPPAHGYSWLNKADVIIHEKEKIVLYHHYISGDWPWSYGLIQTFTIEKNVLRIIIELTNKSKITAPAGIGLHPYFNISDDTEINFIMNNSIHLIDTCQYVGCDTFMDWDGVYEISSKDLNIKVSCISNSKLFLGAYRPENANYICLEPITHKLNSENILSNINGLDSLMPNQTLSIEFNLEIKRT